MLPIENMSKILLELTLRPIPRHCFMSGKKILHYWLIWLELPLLSSLSSSLDNTNKRTHEAGGLLLPPSYQMKRLTNKWMSRLVQQKPIQKYGPARGSGTYSSSSKAMSTMAKCQENHYWRKCARRTKQLRAHMRAIRDRRAKELVCELLLHPIWGQLFDLITTVLAKYLLMLIIT